MRMLWIAALVLLTACAQNDKAVGKNSETGVRKSSAAPMTDDEIEKLKKTTLKQYAGKKPKSWGAYLPRIVRKITTNALVIALTFDACGGAHDGYDKDLIDFLIRERIPATLFINGRWMDKFPGEFRDLATNALFEIESHGLTHRPLSINGRKAYGIEGTRDASEMFDEIEENAQKIVRLTGRKPIYFRCGTAYYDDVGIDMIYKLGYKPIGFNVNGDAGTEYAKERILQEMMKAQGGAIVLMHMNHPEKETAEGVMLAVPELKKKGFVFVKLEGVVR